MLSPMRMLAMKPLRLVIITICLYSMICSAAKNDNNVNKPPFFVDSRNNNKNTSNFLEMDFISNINYFAKDNNRIIATRRLWNETLKEIKALVIPRKSSLNQGSNNIFNQWKLLLTDEGFEKVTDDDISKESTSKQNVEGSLVAGKNCDIDPLLDDSMIKTVNFFSPRRQMRQRFDGFATWETRLQQWSDDVADYLGTSNLIGGLDSEVDYPMSNYGRPSKLKSESQNKNVEGDDSRLISNNKNAVPQQWDIKSDTSTEINNYTSLCVPRLVKPNEPVVPHTDIGDKSKHIWIVTTAALPWMTGTAVNPLLRSAYLTRGRSHSGGSVTLMLPWVERAHDQKKLYGEANLFATQKDQEEYIRKWLSDSANLKQESKELNIAWYTGWLEPLENSIYCMGDITALIPVEQADICVLEEPEHLNWYRRPGESWTKKFKHVVGIVHTNYFVYAQEQDAAFIRAPAMRLLSSWMIRAHCHRVIKLSGTLGKFAPEKELVENVHGVRRTFLDYGVELSQILQSPQGKTHHIFGAEAVPTVYFIGKMLWSKGIGSLMELLKYAEEVAELKVKVDMYGGGPSKDEALVRAKTLDLDMSFHGPIDHSSLASSHKIFVNPSVSEVLCTTVAEALAMGKFVVVPSHPSNDFFAQFPNCLLYANKEEFVGNLYFALTHSPEPLSKEYTNALSWEAATERFAAAGSISMNEAEAFASIPNADAGIEIDLPPLIEDEQRRKQISTTLKKNRFRFRQFRSKLSQEIQQSNVLPKNIQHRLVKELDERLDLDFDSLFGSTKVRIQLSPAELDEQLLDLYNTIAEGEFGDVFRVIGGGAEVGRQQHYLKQQALAVRRNALQKSAKNELSDVSLGSERHDSPTFDEDLGTGEYLSATKWVKGALRRNFQHGQTFLPKTKLKNDQKEDGSTNLRMSFSHSIARTKAKKTDLHCCVHINPISSMHMSLRSTFLSPLI